MFDVCTQLPHGVSVLAFVLWQVFEWAMGKTKFGSTLGLLVEHPVATILSWFTGKKDESSN